jgi:hypothetical protein
MESLLRISSFTIIVLCILFLSCSNESKNISQTKIIIDPNPTSEMAMLMRNMTNQLDSLKNNFENNLNTENALLNFDLIHTKKTTDRSFDQAHIKPMSEAFDYSVKVFNRSPIKKNYNAIVNNCVNCHQLSCQGPLVKIHKLIIR